MNIIPLFTILNRVQLRNLDVCASAFITAVKAKSLELSAFQAFFVWLILTVVQESLRCCVTNCDNGVM